MKKTMIVLGISAALCAAGAVLAAGCSAQGERIAVDLYDYETLSVRNAYDVFFSDYFPEGTRCGAYAQGCDFTVFKDRVRLTGLTEGEVSVTLGNEERRVGLRLCITSTAAYNLPNGGFEDGTLSGWEGDEVFGVSDEVTYFDNLYTPTPAVGQDGWYFLDSFGMADGLSREGETGVLRSAEFTAAGSGYVTFKLGGGCSDDVYLLLRSGEETVAVFQNYAFSDPYASLGLTEYFYRIPQERMGERLYFELHDHAASDFGGITADSFRTYYENAPDVAGMLEAGSTAERNDRGEWVVYEGGSGTRRAYSPYFTLDGNLAFTLEGGNSERLKLRLVSDAGEELALFNNWRKRESSYIFPVEGLLGTRCRFVLDDAERDGDLAVKSFWTTDDLPDDSDTFLAAFMQGRPYDLAGQLRPAEAPVSLDGSFDTLDNWFTVDLEGYGIYEDAAFYADRYPNNPPVYGADGRFLTGGFLGGDCSGFAGTGTLYSRAFTVAGSGYLTFKLGGGNLETLSLRLMLYDEGGEHREIARFNNYLFSEPYRSMALTTYGYRIPEKYLGSVCFLMLVDEERTAAYGALSLDSVQTYYEQVPVLYTGSAAIVSDRADSITVAEDTNIYPAGYMVPSIHDLTPYLGLETAGRSIRNGGFEQGSGGWFSADPDAFSSYRVSDETTYFDTIYPHHVPIFNKTGVYFLNGFAGEGFRGSIYSQAFVAGGWITFKLGGGNAEGVRLRLMCYVDGVNDKEIARFNNYLFSDPYRSMTLTRYAYRIPAEYDGAYCYFIIEDELTSGFGAITLDEVVTSYASPPVIDGTPTDAPEEDTTFPAGYLGGAYAQ